MHQHEVPTHLQVDDRILAGLTVRQALAVALGLASAYWLWEHAAVPSLPRTLLAVLMALFGLVAALVRPGGHDLLTYLGLLAIYALTPHRTVWRRMALPATTLPPVGAPRGQRPSARRTRGYRRCSGERGAW